MEKDKIVSLFLFLRTKNIFFNKFLKLYNEKSSLFVKISLEKKLHEKMALKFFSLNFSFPVALNSFRRKVSSLFDSVRKKVFL